MYSIYEYKYVYVVCMYCMYVCLYIIYLCMHVEYVFMYEIDFNNCQLGLVGARQSASGEGKGEEKGGEQGKLLLSGRFVAAFSNEEEDELGLRERLPQLTEDAMDAQGAICVPAEPWYVRMYVCVSYPIAGGRVPHAMELAGRPTWWWMGGWSRGRIRSHPSRRCHFHSSPLPRHPDLTYPCHSLYLADGAANAGCLAQLGRRVFRPAQCEQALGKLVD